jgi:hypothetical protein
MDLRETRWDGMDWIDLGVVSIVLSGEDIRWLIIWLLYIYSDMKQNSTFRVITLFFISEIKFFITR